MAKMETMYQVINNKHQLEGRRTETLGHNFLEIRNVIAKKTQESIGNNAKNQNRGGRGWKSRRNWARRRESGIKIGNWIGEARTYPNIIYSMFGGG